MSEYIPRKDLADLQPDNLIRRLTYEADGQVHTWYRCTTIGCTNDTHSGVCAECLKRELEARKA